MLLSAVPVSRLLITVLPLPVLLPTTLVTLVLSPLVFVFARRLLLVPLVVRYPLELVQEAAVVREDVHAVGGGELLVLVSE